MCKLTSDHGASSPCMDYGLLRPWQITSPTEATSCSSEEDPYHCRIRNINELSHNRLQTGLPKYSPQKKKMNSEGRTPIAVEKRCFEQPSVTRALTEIQWPSYIHLEHVTNICGFQAQKPAVEFKWFSILQNF
jgi:hypothetical protein